MFNLLRMDLYRMKRSKFVYVCFACLLFVIALCYVMVYLVSTPKGRELGAKIGMVVVTEDSDGAAIVLEDTGDDDELGSLLEDENLLGMYRESNMDGGMYHVIFGIAVALLVCGDYQGGFIKNIMALHKARWTYIGSKLMAAGILNFLYLILSYGFNMLMNLLFGNMVPAAPLGEVAFYLAWAWLVSMAFGSLVILLCVASRSTTIGVTGSVLLGSGLVVMLVSSITNQFNLSGWLEYTLYYNISYGSSAYVSAADLRPAAVGLVFLIIYAIVSCISLAKQDI